MPVTKTRAVRDYMSSPATTIPCTASLLDAALTLRRAHCRHLPVVEGEQLVGIITERDVNRLSPSMLEKITPEQYNALLESTPLERVMTRHPVAIGPEAPVSEAVALLRSKQLGCLPVVESGRVIGILTVTDMLDLLDRLLGSEPGNAARE